MELLLEALSDFTLKILMAAAIISIIVEMLAAEDGDERKVAWIEGFAILIAVFVCSMVTATNNYQKERQFQKLNQEAEDRKLMNIKRNGQLMVINIEQVMVGDIVILSEGQEIPADGFVLEANELTTDESAMTGETGNRDPRPDGTAPPRTHTHIFGIFSSVVGVRVLEFSGSKSPAHWCLVLG